MFNIRNYSPEVINTQRREAELNIILLRVSSGSIWYSLRAHGGDENVEKMFELKEAQYCPEKQVNYFFKDFLIIF